MKIDPTGIRPTTARSKVGSPGNAGASDFAKNLGLLMGTIPMAKLEQLAQLMRAKREQFDDPKLQEILDDIELRAAVELAKLSRSL